MRTFSSAIQTLINNETVSFFFLIELNFASDYYFTSHSSDIEVTEADGTVKTFLADGGLFEVDSPRFSSTVDRESYRVVIADATNQMLSEFKNNVVGKDITVKVGFLDNNGIPLNSLGDLIFIYKGYVDAPSISNDFNEKLAVIEGTSPMSDLDSVNVFYTSKDGMDQKNVLDTSFDAIYGNREITIKWGKV
jgi:hypothetical protein